MNGGSRSYCCGARGHSAGVAHGMYSGAVKDKQIREAYQGGSGNRSTSGKNASPP